MAQTVTTAPAISQLRDDFNDNTRNTSIWNTGNFGTPFGPADSSVVVSEANQRLQIKPRTNYDGNAYNGYTTARSYNLTGYSVRVQVLGTASGASGDTQFTVGVDQSHFAQFVVQNNVLFTQYYNGAFHVVGKTSGTPFSPTNQRWWRFRESGGTLFFEVSANASTWSALASVAAPFSTAAVYVNLNAGTWAKESTETTAIFDNLNVTPSTATPVPSPSPTPSPAVAASTTSAPTAPPSITVTHVDTMVSGSGYGDYGTFGSHNQKVVANSHGIFMTYLHSDNISAGTDNSVWRLARSTDGGKTFTTIYTGTGRNTKTPPIESDANDNVYAFAPDVSGGSWGSTPTTLYKFSPSNNYGTPTITTNIGSSAGKVTTAFDAGRQLLYYATWSNAGKSDLYAVRLDGTIAWSKEIYAYNNTYFAHYPQISVGPDGTLYFAWTVTDLTASGQDYYDAHFILSKDGGTTWTGKNGTISAFPIDPGPNGPGWQVVDSSDIASVGTTQVNWLSNMAYNGGHLDFVYDKDFGSKEVYKRFNLTTHAYDAEVGPKLHGETISMNAAHGFFAQDTTGNDRLFYASDGSNGAIGILYSDDHGTTWHDYAKSPSITTASENAITFLGGARTLMSDGSVVGSFTLTSGDGQPSDVYFFRATP